MSIFLCSLGLCILSLHFINLLYILKNSNIIAHSQNTKKFCKASARIMYTLKLIPEPESKLKIKLEEK